MMLGTKFGDDPKLMTNIFILDIWISACLIYLPIEPALFSNKIRKSTSTFSLLVCCCTANSSTNDHQDVDQFSLKFILKFIELPASFPKHQKVLENSLYLKQAQKTFLLYVFSEKS